MGSHELEIALSNKICCQVTRPGQIILVKRAAGNLLESNANVHCPSDWNVTLHLLGLGQGQASINKTGLKQIVETEQAVVTTMK